MNDTPNDKEEFIVERHDRAARDTDVDKSSEQKAVNQAPPERTPSATIDDDGFPDRIHRKYYVVSADAGK